MTSHHPDRPDDAPSTGLPRQTQRAMLVVTTLQGLLLYALDMRWWDQSPMVGYIGLALAVAIPSFFVFCVVDLRDRLMWFCMALAAGLMTGLCFSVWWMSGGVGQGVDGVQSTHTIRRVWSPWLLALALGWFIGLAWVQALLQWRSLRRIPYASLFAQGWNNATVLGFTGLFVGLCWALLGLWAGLFALVQVNFFGKLFTHPAFVSIATGVMLGLGLILARDQPRPMQVLLQLILALFRLLLPLLALVVLLFVLALPLTGVQPLWDTRRAAPLLMGVLLCLLLCVNAVYQDGSRDRAPYPALLRWLIDAALVLMPMLAGLAMWAVLLRVRQYGWTHERIWALLAAGVLLLYALGYAAAALMRPVTTWLQEVARINRALSWLVLALLVLLHTPLLDPYRFSAASQSERIAQGLTPPSRVALQNLRFDHGRHGLAALQALQSVPTLAQAQQDLQWALGLQYKESLSGQMDEDAVDWRQLIAAAPGHNLPSDDWLQAVNQTRLGSTLWRCKPRPRGAQSSASAVPPSGGPQCLSLQLSLQQDAPPQQLICLVEEDYQPNCQIYGRDKDGKWEQQGQLTWDHRISEEQAQQLVAALRRGQLAPQASRWDDAMVPGTDLPPGRVSLD